MINPPSPASTRPSTDLRARAREIATENGFVTDFSPEVEAEVAALSKSSDTAAPVDEIRDLRSMLWSSIDNRESRDLDQVEFCESLDGGRTRLRLGIADVDRDVPKGSPIDLRAAANTTSLYTGVETFPMLPEALTMPAM
jgi:ribonuclease R